MARARHAKVVPAAEHLREQRLAEVLAAGPAAAKGEAARWRLLNDPDGMALLHRHVWDDPAGANWLARYRDEYPKAFLTVRRPARVEIAAPCGAQAAWRC